MGRELGQGKGPGDCISLLVFPTAGLQHPGRKSLAAGNLHLQGVSILVPFPPRPCLCPWELLSRPGVQGGSGCLTPPPSSGLGFVTKPSEHPAPLPGLFPAPGIAPRGRVGGELWEICCCHPCSPFPGDSRLGRAQGRAAGGGPGALGERRGFPGH